MAVRGTRAALCLSLVFGRVAGLGNGWGRVAEGIRTAGADRPSVAETDSGRTHGIDSRVATEGRGGASRVADDRSALRLRAGRGTRIAAGGAHKRGPVVVAQGLTQAPPLVGASRRACRQTLAAGLLFESGSPAL